MIRRLDIDRPCVSCGAEAAPMFDGGPAYALCEQCAAFERAEKIISAAIAFRGECRYKTENGRVGRSGGCDER